MRKRGKGNMKLTDLKKVKIILLVMIVFLSYQRPVLAAVDYTNVKIPVQQIFSSEAEKVSDEFSYVMTTNQNEAPMPEGSRNLQYFWTMKNNVGAEIVMKVRKVGRYQYKIYQTSEKKDNYLYDQNSYVVIVEAFYDQEDQLKVATVVKNDTGEKVERITFENSYIGKEKEDLSHLSVSSKSDRVKTGDDNTIMGYFLLLLISGICLSILIDGKRPIRGCIEISGCCM